MSSTFHANASDLVIAIAIIHPWIDEDVVPIANRNAAGTNAISHKFKKKPCAKKISGVMDFTQKIRIAGNDIRLKSAQVRMLGLLF